ncbi:uncharacterized protein LOC103697615 [Phoenix dactylifera]|uniref:Uncharacterized protein LOC103697615 n=1 Tax=Phoenix dactylifera TaxID=42345 RepID=A0A8B7BIN3_PHODC|nr:uncharacterized protein LOC103697615 [Phoenix dactylifera]
MGNCVFRGFGEGGGLMIKVVTINGGVMELHPPVTVECITNGFPGHGIFRSRDLFSKPLLHNEELVGGELYYLRPLSDSHKGLPSLVAPYRVSFDHHGFWRRQDMEVVPKFHTNGGNGGGVGGVWKVKLVISPAQLNEILSQDSRTEALIESVRTVAKCGNGAASVASSDQWSLASSRKASSESMD